MILLVDNYDLFTYNLAQYLGTFAEVQVLRNDDVGLEVAAQAADALVLSPGPGWPADSGKMEALIETFAKEKPILGICLGHQAIAETFGGQLGLAHKVMHGKQSEMAVIADSPLFEGMGSTLLIMRYHSIVVTDLPKGFEVVAKTTDDQEIMAIQHQELPIYGLQFHPESIGTPDGLQMIEQFVQLVREDKGRRENERSISSNG